MQFPSRSNQPSSGGRQLILIFFGAMLIAAAIFVLISQSAHHNQKNVPVDQTYQDTRSGQTVSNPTNKTPENYGNAYHDPIYLGITKLLDYGVTSSQLDATKLAFSDFSRLHGNSVDEVSIDVKTIKVLPYDSNSADLKQTLTFNVQFNRKDTYDAQLDYTGLSIIHLYLKQQGKTVYDSGDIDGNPTPGE